jgi:hypothetical protein
MIELRETQDGDLLVFWHHLSDPSAQRMAAFTRP